MKKNIVISILLALMMVLMLVSCSGGSSNSAEEPAGEPAAAEEGQEVGMANPWSDVESAQAAAEGAGIDGFEAAEGTAISLGEVKVEQYRCMDGMAEARIPIAAVDMTIRKGRPDTSPEGNGDISGDYGEYAHEWTADINGTEVKCYGNRKGESTKTIWTSGDYSYCILAFGAGGDENYGLPADDVKALVNAIK